MKDYYIYILFFFIVIEINGQTTYFYPTQFTQYSRYMPFINPATICSYNNIEFITGSKNYLSYYSNFSNYFGSLSIIPSNKSKKSYSSAGLRFDTENEGKYIRRSRIYLAYSFHFPAFKDYFVSGGIDFGTVNYSIRVTPTIAYGGKSEYAPDANFGLFLYNEKLQIGFSVNQIFNGKFQPYNEISILKRHYNLYIARTIKFDNDIRIKPQILFRIPSYISFNANLIFETYWKSFIMGGSIKYKEGSAIFIGVSSMKIDKKGVLDLIVNYNFPVKNSMINIKSLEMIISYKL